MADFKESIQFTGFEKEKYKKMAKKGVVLIAAGHPFYGKMARNLAMGIKRYSNVEIALFHDGAAISHFNDFDKSFFSLHPLPEYTYKSNSGPDSYLRCKTFLHDITPFTETIFLDADLIWHEDKNIDDLFNSLKEVDYTMINEGHLNFKTGENTISRNYHFWAKPDAIKQGYEGEKTLKDAKLYQLRSEFIYFKKNQANKKFFQLARQIYDHPKCHSVKFGNVLPDETAFDIASAILHHYPHKDSYTPIYWSFLYKYLRLPVGEIYQRYYAYSMGGARVTDEQIDIYNSIYTKHCQFYGVKPDHKWIDKNRFQNHHLAPVK